MSLRHAWAAHALPQAYPSSQSIDIHPKSLQYGADPEPALPALLCCAAQLTRASALP